ncbi:MAG: helix-turn-helix transcriptional regulator [Pseudomonadota bacterium]
MTLRTAEQLRAARALLKLKQSEVAELSDVSEATVRRLENERGTLGIQVTTLDKLQRAFEKAGVRFIGEAEASLDGGPGVRLEKAAD